MEEIRRIARATASRREISLECTRNLFLEAIVRGGLETIKKRLVINTGRLQEHELQHRVFLVGVQPFDGQPQQLALLIDAELVPDFGKPCQGLANLRGSHLDRLLLRQPLIQVLEVFLQRPLAPPDAVVLELELTLVDGAGVQAVRPASELVVQFGQLRDQAFPFTRID